MEVLSRQKFSLLFLEKHHAVLPLKFTIVRRYHIYCLFIHKSCCSTIKAKQIELLSNFLEIIAYTEYIKTQMVGDKEHLGSHTQSS